MFVCGYDYCGCENTPCVTPTCIDDINYVELYDGLFDDLFITNATDFEFDSELPGDWDFDTILWAKFNASTNAGNVDWNLDTVSYLTIKKRIKNEYTWKTLVVQETTELEDFSMYYNDYTSAAGETSEYALVPIMYSTEEGSYNTVSIQSEFSKLFLIENDIVYGTEISDCFVNTTRNIPSANVELLNYKYPIFVRNSIANYDTGEFSGSFMPGGSEGDECVELDYSSSGDYVRTRFQREIMDFICDGIPKILKLPDGRKWLIQVTPNPTDNADEIYNDRTVNFSWVEIGDVDSEEDLYYLGVSDVAPEWWSSN